MKKMEANKNHLEGPAIANGKPSKQGGKFRLIKGLGFIGVFLIGWKMAQVLNFNPINVTELVPDIDYEVVQLKEEPGMITVDLEMPLETESVTTVVKAIVSEIRAHESYQLGDEIRVEVFDNLKTETEKPGLADPSHGFTGVYTDALKLYSTKDFSDVEADIFAIDLWNIEKSYLEEGHLIGEVLLLSECSEESKVFAQLKALESEMMRFNEIEEGKETYFYAPHLNQITYSYSSVYPNHLIIEQNLTIE